MELTLTHVSLALSGSTLIVLLKVSYQVGRYMEKFEELQQRVRLHDKLLGVPAVAYTGEK